MRVSRTGLEQLLLTNVVELKFNRRMMKPGWPMHRRMLCTLNTRILSGVEGKYALNFRPATQQPPYDPAVYNLVGAWDIFMQDWRMIPVESVDVVTVIPENKFWDFFGEVLSSMSAASKERFMKS